MLKDTPIQKLIQEEFSVSEVSNKIKILLESNFSTIRVKGEVSSLKIATSGHAYFSLKDNNAIIATNCWRPRMQRLKFKLKEGMEVVVTGKLSSYAPQSRYQLSADFIEPSGIGAFMQILTERRKKFQAMGYFDKSKKKKIPFLSKKIGIITSLSGAVIQDVIHRIKERCPVHLLIWPVAVQGENSASEVEIAIKGFNELDKNAPELIIIARGGGSIEDLWSFNEENVIEAAYRSKIPIISAIGHETDWSLLDLVSDLRAPTPTAAAEFVTPVKLDLLNKLEHFYSKIMSRLTDQLKYNNHRLGVVTGVLYRFETNIENYTQRVDDYAIRLVNSLPSMLVQKQRILNNYPTSRLSPLRLFKYKILQYQNNNNALMQRKDSLLTNFMHRYEINDNVLTSLDYNNVLKRGFAMIRTSSDGYISSLKEARSKKTRNEELILKMKDGETKMKLL